MQKEDILKNIWLFKELSPSKLQDLSKISTFKNYKKSNILFYEGEQAESLFILLEGKLKIYKIDSNNNEIILHLLKPVSLIAEMVYFEDIKFPANASFMQDSKVLAIDYKIFKEQFLKNEDILLNFIKSLNHKIMLLEKVISNKITLKAKEKIAKYIFNNAQKLDLLTQRQIAKELFMAPETLSRHLKILKKDKIIQIVKTKIQILNKQELRDIFEAI